MANDKNNVEYKGLKKNSHCIEYDNKNPYQKFYRISSIFSGMHRNLVGNNFPRVPILC